MSFIFFILLTEGLPALDHLKSILYARISSTAINYLPSGRRYFVQFTLRNELLSRIDQLIELSIRFIFQYPSPKNILAKRYQAYTS